MESKKQFEEFKRAIQEMLPEGETFFGAAPMPLGMYLISSTRENEHAPIVIRGFYAPKEVMTDFLVACVDEKAAEAWAKSFIMFVLRQLVHRFGVRA